jgi:hypothetical protein
MSTETTKADRGRHNRSLTHKQFFLLCEELRNRREVLQNEGPTIVQCARQMSARLGFPVSEGSLRGAQEATGITWERKLQARGVGHTAEQRRQRSRTLAQAVKRLYEELGVEAKLPASFKAEFAELWQSPPETQAPEQPPLPPPGTVVFKVGDKVLWGAHVLPYKIVALTEAGRLALIESPSGNRHNVKVEYLKPA